MQQNNILGGFVALISAITWGSGDFAGGLASRKQSQVQVLVMATFSGALSLAIAMFIRGEALPGTISILWSVAAGVLGAMGMICLYRGLAIGQAALVAPTATVIGVIFPVIVGTLTHGAPGLEKFAGMLIGLLGIWLTTRGTEKNQTLRGLGLAVLAGLGFGGFFLCIVRVDTASIFAPLLLAKLTAFLFAVLILAFRRTALPSLKGSGLAILAGILDAAGNLFYLLAARLTRLELAAVISSMAPAMTVILASIISRQQISFWQKLGVSLSLLGVALIMI